MRDALVGLGEPDSQRIGAKPDRVRRIAVGARSAEAIANAAEKILSSDKQFRNSVRVVVPGQTGRIAVVVDKSAFESKDGQLEDLILQVFREDGLQQVAVVLEHTLLRK